MYDLAPIVLFTYNRPEHTQKVIEALIQNPLAIKSDLFIYSDAPKNQENTALVQKVREYIHSVKGFKQITIIEREQNFGLADSIIDGVTRVVNQYGKIIVLEDDIVVSLAFLEYMNLALEKYENQSKIWCISGWNYPLEPNPIKGDTFFWRIPHCWGWATWKDRWKYYKRDINWVEQNFTKNDIYEISLHKTSEYWNHYLLNKKNKIKSWAIFWYLIAYKHNSLTLMPKISLIKQIGFDNSGSHCGLFDPLDSDIITHKVPKNFPTNLQENSDAFNAIKNFHRKNKFNFFKRLLNKIKRILSK